MWKKARIPTKTVTRNGRRDFPHAWSFRLQQMKGPVNIRDIDVYIYTHICVYVYSQCCDEDRKVKGDR